MFITKRYLTRRAIELVDQRASYLGLTGQPGVLHLRDEGCKPVHRDLAEHDRLPNRACYLGGKIVEPAFIAAELRDQAIESRRIGERAGDEISFIRDGE